MHTGKVIIFSAPSGSGKSSIINKIIDKISSLTFSVSATSRPPRGQEQDGKDYYFLTEKEFRRHIENADFLEYEEVYPGRFYGTLRSEVDRRISNGENVILDIDVVGALNVKKIYGSTALSIFIMPPSIEELRKRLEKRGTDEQSVIEQRIAKASHELTYSSKFDKIVVNENLEQACVEVEKILRTFIGIED